MILKGKAHRFGRDIDTDVIIAARYLNTTDMKELSRHCMEDADPDFPQRVTPGDIIIADENFGCGSSREHAPWVIKELGISCVIAKSFARIFYRNAINIGLPILICSEVVDAAGNGDAVSVDTEAGIVAVNGVEFKAQPFPPFLQVLIDEGGLMKYARRKLGIGK